MDNIELIYNNKNETDDYCVASYKLIYDDDFAHLFFTIHCDNPLVTKHNKYYRNTYCIIQYVFTKEEYRNKKYATCLLLYLQEYCKNNNVKIIKLDDCSARFNHSNNLYLKNGFKYVTCGEPEMSFTF